MVNKMDPELKRKWVEALRSGRYQQAHGELRSEEGGYCCLAVLHETAGGHWVLGTDGVWMPAETKVRHEDLTYVGVHLSTAFYDAIGLGERAALLAEMNDGTSGFFKNGPAPFSQIADYIEQEL